MLNITISNNNISEKQYIIGVIFSEFLGLDFITKIDNGYNDYSIKFENKELLIKDKFFNLFPDDLTYLTLEALPKKIIYAKNDFATEAKIPVIYGDDEFYFEDDTIICGIDIFASSFFFLSRWEEYVLKIVDEHLRFPANASFAYKNSLLNRPLVNEYIELLWKLLLKLGFKGQRKARAFDLVLTHDIDQLNYPKTHHIIAGDILKRKSIDLMYKHSKYFLKTLSNPYDTFNLIMNISEDLGLKSHFYFMSSDLLKYPDNDFYINSKRFKNKIRDIKKRGHIIGFHPGYYTYDNYERWKYEKEILENAINDQVTEGRQHYLRFKIPDTFNIWNNMNMEIDSSLGYANKDGFRCGTGDIYSVFDFIKRKPLNLKERPLILMDGALKQFSLTEADNIVQNYISLSKKYNMCLTFLFHNTTFYGESWKGFDWLYKKILDHGF